MEPVTYVTKYKGLELVNKPMGLKDAQGNKVPSVRCAFMPTPQGYAFTTANVDLIKWLDGHEYTKHNKIQRLEMGGLPVEATQVKRGGITSGVQEEPTPVVPKTTATKPHVAKISK